jgi:transcriptional antiterminator NusG
MSEENVIAEEVGAEEKQVPAEAQWYVVHTYSGYEDKVCQNLIKRIDSMKMQDKIFDAIVPKVTETDFTKDGKRKNFLRKIYPGYVFVQMIMDDRAWYVVRNTPGVTGFVASGEKPDSLLPDEMTEVKQKMGLVAQPKVKCDLAVGETVRVCSGAFEGSLGVIKSVNPDNDKVKIIINAQSRDIPVDLTVGQVEKLKD